MTNAIEQTKRALYDCLDRIRRAAKHRFLTAEFESRLEEHLEQVRQESKKHEERTACAIGVGDGAGQRFVYGDYDSVKAVQSLILSGEDSRKQLAAMTKNRDELARSNLAGDEAYAKLREERDQIQQRLHAIDHAHYNLDQANKLAGEELRVCHNNLRHWKNEAGALHSRLAVLENGERFQRMQQELEGAKEQARIERQDVMRAEKFSEDLDDQLRDARQVIAHQEILIVSQRLAIADLYMKAAAAPRASK